MTTTDRLIVPSIHRNGTCADDLLEVRFAALDALHAAGDALAKMAPNGRDYYVQGSDAYGAADKQHTARIDSLRSTIADITEEISHIQDTMYV